MADASAHHRYDPYGYDDSDYSDYSDYDMSSNYKHRSQLDSAFLLALFGRPQSHTR